MTFSRSQIAIHALLSVCILLFTAPAFSDTAADSFQEVVTKYLSADPKPRLPEEAHKFQVQAEFAIQQKRFDLAAQLFAQALEIAPWWPAGHFNRALILGELKQYEGAMLEMKRYLMLTPNAPDARASQEQIYQWELLERTSADEGFSKAMLGRWSFNCSSSEIPMFVGRKMGNMIVVEMHIDVPAGLLHSRMAATVATSIDLNSVKYLGSQEGLRRYSYRDETTATGTDRKMVFDRVIEADSSRRRQIESTGSDGKKGIENGKINGKEVPFTQKCGD